MLLGLRCNVGAYSLSVYSQVVLFGGGSEVLVSLIVCLFSLHTCSCVEIEALRKQTDRPREGEGGDEGD